MGKRNIIVAWDNNRGQHFYKEFERSADGRLFVAKKMKQKTTVKIALWDKGWRVWVVNVDGDWFRTSK